MMKTFRCNCPITSAIDVLGDKWTLVLVKQMLFEDKKTFKDFMEGEEAIATNILSSRLKMLEDYNVIRKEKLPSNKKTNIYLLTEKGLGLVPTIIELTLWSDGHIRDFNPTMTADHRMEILRKNKEESIQTIIESYKRSHWQKAK